MSSKLEFLLEIIRSKLRTTFYSYVFLNSCTFRQNYVGKPNFGVLSLMAATAGSIGAFVGTPAEVALVRMTADGRLPPGYYHLSFNYIVI